MKKFKFRLQSYLNLKIAEKKSIEFELSKCLQLINRHKQQVEIENRYIEKASNDLNQQAMRGVKASHAQAVPEMIEVKRFNIKLHEKAIEDLNHKADEVSKRLHEKEAEIKVLEKMREKSFQNFKKKIEKKENESLEELYQIRKSYKGDEQW